MTIQPEDSSARRFWLDTIEKAFLLTLYAAFLLRILSTVRPGHLLFDLAANLPLLFSEGLVVVFALIRKKTDIISLRPVDWFLAVTVTCLPLLVAPKQGDFQLLPQPIFVTGMFLAFAFQVWAKAALGRSFGLVAANRGLKLHGPYRLVRHPIYLGYLMMHITFFLGNPTLRNMSIYLIFYALQIPRIAAEERLLAQNPLYLEYSKTVRYRLIPGIY